GNSLILYIIKTDKQLFEPMFRLLSMLAVTDLIITLSIVPSVVCLLFFDLRNIHGFACFTQTYCIHTITTIGSTILVAMAFDRYIAICNPLRYASILHPMISKICLTAIIRGVGITLPIPFLLRRLQYCDHNKLYHVFCIHPNVMKLACSDISINIVYGLVVVMFTFVLDSVLILCSYLMILRTVLRIASNKGSLKAFSTCVSHISVVLMFNIPLFSITLVHRYGEDTPPLVHVLMGLSYLCLPQVLNPLIYSMKTEMIQNALYKLVSVEPRKNRNEKHDDVRNTTNTIRTLTRGAE
ncbi:olfactory receptor 51G1-like, partial [Pleurodeles waltl]|uniref:olfactory receptor 51G1-like n=1 Tax=Pleurodeles waltl TaxID=8319 RepID=UPI00370966DD